MKRHWSTKKTLLERFELRVFPEPMSGCWIWTGKRGCRDDYAYFWAGTKEVYAHRWAYEHYVGPIPEGLVIDHLCRTPPCVNPKHLEPVTNLVNLQRAPNYPPNRTHCKRGHSEWGRSRGARYCLACNREKVWARRLAEGDAYLARRRELRRARIARSSEPPEVAAHVTDDVVLALASIEAVGRRTP